MIVGQLIMWLDKFYKIFKFQDDQIFRNKRMQLVIINLI